MTRMFNSRGGRAGPALRSSWVSEGLALTPFLSLHTGRESLIFISQNLPETSVMVFFCCSAVMFT